nr:glycosyltransferase family 4 protein [Bizionia gelidisalsuginis]
MNRKNNVFNQVLYVAPNFKRRKGGIASVLELYSQKVGINFNFYPSAFFQNTILNFLFLPFSLFYYCFYLLFNPKLKIIHIHGASRGSFYRKYFYILISKTIFKKKMIYHIHGAEYHLFYKNASLFVRKRIEHIIEMSDALIVLSEEWKDYYFKTFNKEKIYVVNNIVEKREVFKKQINPIISILFLGKIGQRKGVFDLLEVLKIHKNELLGLVNINIGGNGETSLLKLKIKEFELEDIVNYVGWVTGDKKDLLYKSNDVIILPSYNEGLPISLLEAMSYAMPLISTNVGGIPQILEDKVNGIMIEPGNKEQIFEAIKFYVDNPNKIVNHGANSYMRITPFFPEEVMKQLEIIYNEI